MDIYIYVAFLALIAILIWSSTGSRKLKSQEKQKRYAEELLNKNPKAIARRTRSAVLSTAVIFAGLLFIILVAYSDRGGAAYLIFVPFVGGVGAVIGLIIDAIGRSAESKNRSYTAFALLSLILSPIVMWLIVASMPTNQTSKSRENSPDGANSDILNQIEKLSELRDKGVISDEEFTQKKNQLLERL